MSSAAVFQNSATLDKLKIYYPDKCEQSEEKGECERYRNEQAAMVLSNSSKHIEAASHNMLRCRLFSLVCPVFPVFPGGFFFWFFGPVDARETCFGPCVAAGAYTAVIVSSMTSTAVLFGIYDSVTKQCVGERTVILCCLCLTSLPGVRSSTVGGNQVRKLCNTPEKVTLELDQWEQEEGLVSCKLMRRLLYAMRICGVVRNKLAVTGFDIGLIFLLFTFSLSLSLGLSLRL